jgi:hypothetical protein
MAISAPSRRPPRRRCPKHAAVRSPFCPGRMASRSAGRPAEGRDESAFFGALLASGAAEPANLNNNKSNYRRKVVLSAALQRADTIAGRQMKVAAHRYGQTNEHSERLISST